MVLVLMKRLHLVAVEENIKQSRMVEIMLMGNDVDELLSRSANT